MARSTLAGNEQVNQTLWNELAEATNTHSSPITQYDQEELSASILGIIPITPLWGTAQALWSILHPWLRKHFPLQLLRSHTEFAVFSTSFPLPFRHWEEQGTAHQEPWCWRDMIVAVRIWRAWIWELCFLLCHRILCYQTSNASLLPAKQKGNFCHTSQEWRTALIKIEPCSVAQAGMCRCWWDKQKHLFYDYWTQCLQTEGEHLLFYYTQLSTKCQLTEISGRDF